MADRVTAFGPGRVNLIGEHTDYNDGLALPFAIDAGVTVNARHTGEDTVHVIAVDLGAHDTFALSAPPPVRGWRAFARGIAAELAGAGVPLRGARLEITGTVPRGSGLSSSAALEVALALALIAVGGGPEPDRLMLAQLCSRVENDWAGARTGLLDQMASLLGERDAAVRIDFRSLETVRVPLALGDHVLVTLDSGDRHSNAGEEGYNTRRRECARACELLGIDSLRDATVAAAAELPPPLGRRVRHVVSENERVTATVRALAAGDLDTVGMLLNASHASLRDDYEVSTPAVEAAVGRLRQAGALGARIMGGGFGGHVLGLMAPGADPPPEALTVVPGEGARLLR